MREDLSATMQALLYDPTLMTEEEGAEGPPCGTPQVPPFCHAQENEGPINMHEDTPHQPILEGAPYLKRRKGVNLQLLLIVTRLHAGDVCNLHHHK